MPKDLNPSKMHLIRAINSLPQGTATEGISAAMRRALNEMDEVDRKHARRQEPQQTVLSKWQENIRNRVDPRFAKESLAKIKEIADAEAKNLENIQQKGKNVDLGTIP